MSLTYAIPAARHRNCVQVVHQRIPRGPGPEIGPSMHNMRIPFDIAQRKGIIVQWGLRKVHGAGCSVVAAVGIHQRQHIFNLSQC
jgi:hypothetical protein